MKAPRMIAGLSLLTCAALALLLQADAYPRYQDGCNNCHGAFTDGTSTKGSTFPGDNKHAMHRDSAYMNTECDLCHTQGDNRNPWIGSSDGTAINTGLGCTGCHNGIGLREHHAANGLSGLCYSTCHSAMTAPPENTPPPYYGTVDTNVDDPCNTVATVNTGENWTVTDSVGIDNDGDDVYDTADSDCAPAGNTPGEVSSLIVAAHSGATVDLSYTSGCATSDNILVWGDLTGVSSYSYDGQLCSVGNSGSLNWTLSAGNVFFLLVGNDGTGEGSYGRASTGVERPEETACTFTQDLSNTCVN